MLSNAVPPEFDNRATDAVERHRSGRARWARSRAHRSALAARRALPQRCALCAAPQRQRAAVRRLRGGASAHRRARARGARCPSRGCGASAARALRIRRRTSPRSPPSPTRFRSTDCCRQFKYGGRLALAGLARAGAVRGASRASREARRRPIASSRCRSRRDASASAASTRRTGDRASRGETASACRSRTACAERATRRRRPRCAWRNARRNVRGAFAARRRISRRKSVAIVDDVMTTGATLAAAARALLRGRCRARRGLGRGAHAAARRSRD